jgi:hypothetical protein
MDPNSSYKLRAELAKSNSRKRAHPCKPSRILTRGSMHARPRCANPAQLMQRRLMPSRLTSAARTCLRRRTAPTPATEVRLVAPRPGAPRGAENVAASVLLRPPTPNEPFLRPCAQRLLESDSLEAPAAQSCTASFHRETDTPNFEPAKIMCILH